MPDLRPIPPAKTWPRRLPISDTGSRTHGLVAREPLDQPETRTRNASGRGPRWPGKFSKCQMGRVKRRSCEQV